MLGGRVILSYEEEHSEHRTAKEIVIFNFLEKSHLIRRDLLKTDRLCLTNDICAFFF